MRWIITCIAAVFMGVVVVTGGCGRLGDEKEIRKAWADYDRAADERDGARAVEIVSKGTLEYLGELVRVALDGRREDVLKLRPSEMFMVLQIKSRGRREVFEKLDGAGYVRWATEHGWWESEYLDIPELHKVHFINDDKAVAEMVIDGTTAGDPAVFLREDGKWKFSEASLYAFWDDLWEQDAKELGVPVADLIAEAIAIDGGWENGRLLPHAWGPMK